MIKDERPPASLRGSPICTRPHKEGSPETVIATFPTSEAGYAKYTDYIKNTGGKPTVEWFDEDRLRVPRAKP